MSAPRIEVSEAQRRLSNSTAKLICAYEEPEKCRQYHIDGATPFHQFQPMVTKLPKDAELIFYCA